MPGGDRPSTGESSLAYVRLVSPSLLSVYCFNGTTGASKELMAELQPGKAGQGKHVLLQNTVLHRNSSHPDGLTSATEYSTAPSARRMLARAKTAVAGCINM